MSRETVCFSTIFLRFLYEINWLWEMELPFHHKDPFGRLIVSQALCEKINLLSNDQIFDIYFLENDIKRIFS